MSFQCRVAPIQRSGNGADGGPSLECDLVRVVGVVGVGGVVGVLGEEVVGGDSRGNTVHVCMCMCVCVYVYVCVYVHVGETLHISRLSVRICT